MKTCRTASSNTTGHGWGGRADANGRVKPNDCGVSDLGAPGRRVLNCTQQLLQLLAHGRDRLFSEQLKIECPVAVVSGRKHDLALRTCGHRNGMWSIERVNDRLCSGVSEFWTVLHDAATLHRSPLFFLETL